MPPDVREDRLAELKEFADLLSRLTAHAREEEQKADADSPEFAMAFAMLAESLGEVATVAAGMARSSVLQHG